MRGTVINISNIGSTDYAITTQFSQSIRGLLGTVTNFTLKPNQTAILSQTYATSFFLVAFEEQGIDTLADVTISSPTDGQVLSYDSASSEWVNADPSGGGGVPEIDVSSPSATETLDAPSAPEEVYIYTPSAAITVNLVAAATCGAGFRYHIKNRGSYTLTIDANSTETIDGNQTYELNVAESAVTLVTDGSNWFII
jgi:hypothetical protein